jgi:hypothetical protein
MARMITVQQIDAILRFLAGFEAPDFSPGTWRLPSGQCEWFDYHETVKEFERALYDYGWIISFDWVPWMTTAVKYIISPGKVGQADVVTIQKLFTAHVRGNRFTDGHLAAMFENGHIVALLRRLRELRHSMGD